MIEVALREYLGSARYGLVGQPRDHRLRHDFFGYRHLGHLFQRLGHRVPRQQLSRPVQQELSLLYQLLQLRGNLPRYPEAAERTRWHFLAIDFYCARPEFLISDLPQDRPVAPRHTVVDQVRLYLVLAQRRSLGHAVVDEGYRYPYPKVEGCAVAVNRAAPHVLRIHLLQVAEHHRRAHRLRRGVLRALADYVSLCPTNENLSADADGFVV